jgi:formylglycine-generating enzyme required for sulfatase activity
VRIDAARVPIGPSDWEAEGRVRARVVETGPFELDAFEATVGRATCPACPLANDALFATRDFARAMTGLSRDEAERYCAARGGRLPRGDEWLVAAAGVPPKRYPWGDTGAVCRRAAWGLQHGPCSTRGTGSDTVGSHGDGVGVHGLHDLAGNAAEWIASEADARGGRARGEVRGGSWATAIATDLRTWAGEPVDPASHDPRVGVRCAYDVKPDPAAP